MGAILTLEGGTTVSGGQLWVEYSGELDIETSGATLDGVTVTNDNAIDVGDITSGAILTLEGGTTVSGGTLWIGGGDTLTLNGATISGDTIEIYTSASGTVIAGDIDVTGPSTISDASLNNGNVTIEAGQTLTLDNVAVKRHRDHVRR